MHIHSLILWSHFLILTCCDAAQAAGSLFDRDDILDVDLRGPLARTIKDQKKTNEYPFVLSVGGKEMPVAVRVRGNSRVRVCRFPPLRLNFSSEGTVDTPFAGQDKLKLVTHCKTAAGYQENVLMEYAAYRIFELLSDVSFRTRLLRIRYVDTDNSDREPRIRYGFVIESDKDLATRAQGELLHAHGVAKSRLNLNQAALVFVFQYLIANTDWSLVAAFGEEHCCHNGAFVTIDGEHALVPYDFDLAGLVAAPYARPDPSLGISSVRVRRYVGYCIDEAWIAGALQTVLANRPRIAVIIEGLPGASEKQSRRRLTYLERFYKQAEDVPAFARRLSRQCVDK